MKYNRNCKLETIYRLKYLTAKQNKQFDVSWLN